ncbi:MAG TPA: folylpolyglutamate synthase/dihydrofolate synthase family protein, partial [Candidatus Obscuribacterales bacterium]
MNYLQSITYLESLAPTLVRPTLARIELFMAEQGNIQDKIPCFHVGGTNGKGSTAAILDSVLRAAGLRVGRFTGPHLLRWNERFHIDGRAITDDEFADLASRVRALSEDFGARHSDLGPLTWFEFLTAMAAFLFAEKQMDVAVYEVGLGGRYDATNILKNVLASIVTNVSLDHTQILGDTVAKIAREKAGIIKAGVPVVTACGGSALHELEEKAREVGAPLLVCSFPDQILTADTGVCIDLTDMSRIRSFFPPNLIAQHLALIGAHQQLNALTAVTAIAASRIGCNFTAALMDRISVAALERGLASVRWPGRLQLIQEKMRKDQIVLDGAHNPAGAQALRLALDANFPTAERVFVMSCFGTKDARTLIHSLLRPDDRVFLGEASTRRASHSPEALAEMVRETGAKATPL